MTNINKSCSPENSLIDYFIIIGDHNYFNNTRSNTEGNYKPVINSFKPAILNYIPSVYCKKPKIDEDLLIKLIFSTNFDEFNKNERLNNRDKLFSRKNIILSLKQRYKDGRVFNNYIFGYVFKHKNFIYPQAFCIISEYPYFQFFRSFTEGIEKAIQGYDFEIPLEISLYNMINYIPPSINSSINIQSIPKKDISFDLTKNLPDYKSGWDSNGQQKKVTNYLLHQTYCFPYFDFNITEIIKIISPELLTKIIIFNYLEINMVFFSENQETLNYSLYVLSKLLYPFDDIPYYDGIYSISRDDFIKGNGRIQSESKIYGVNSEYEESILQYIRAQSCFIVDIEKQKMIFIENNSTSESIKVFQIYDYVTKILDYLSNQKNKNKKQNKEEIFSKSKFLFPSIEKLLSHLQEIEKKLDKKEEINCFEKIPNKTIFDGNTKFQNYFLTFHLELLSNFYSFFKLKSNCDNILKYYDKVQLTVNRYYIEVEENYEEFEFQEILFYDLLKRTSKMDHVMNNVFNENGIDQNKIISFSFFEVFIKNLFSKYSKGDENYYLIMKDYFHNSNLVKSTVNFAKFHIFYEKNFKKWVEFGINSHDLSVINDNYFYYDLNEKIIQKYSYYLNNLSINQIKDLFPFLKNFNKNNNTFCRFSFSFYLLKSQLLKTNEINGFIFANILILSSMLISIDGIETLISSLFNSDLINSIYYENIICLFISIYYKLIKKANDSKKQKLIKIARIYIDYLTKKNTLPTQKVLSEINDICTQESKISEILHKNKNKEDILPSNYSKKYKIDFVESKNNFEEVKKKIVTYIKNKTYIFKEMEQFLFNISINNKKIKGITLLSPLDLLNVSNALLEEFQEKSSYQNELMIQSISNIFFYLEVFTEFNVINCECLETVLSN